MAEGEKKLKMLYLSHEDVLKVSLTMSEAMDLCVQCYQEHASGKMENPPKPGIHPQKDSFLHAMPAFLERLKIAGIKWVSGFPDNVPKSLPTIVGLIILNDCETGFPLAILDGTYITAIRTAAASGVSAKHFARPDSEVLSIIGTGVQGKYHTICLLPLLKNLKTIKIFDKYPPSLEGYKNQLSPFIPHGVEVVTVSSFKEACVDSDVIVTATGPVHETIFYDKWVKPGALVMPVHRLGWNEDSLIKFDKLIADDYNQFVSLVKNSYSPIPEKPYAQMGDVITGKKAGRENNKERIISFNCGMAINDMIFAAKIVEKAKELGLGVELDLMDCSKPIPLPDFS